MALMPNPKGPLPFCTARLQKRSVASVMQASSDTHTHDESSIGIPDETSHNDAPVDDEHPDWSGGSKQVTIPSGYTPLKKQDANL
jgi:hypothetical protein